MQSISVSSLLWCRLGCVCTIVSIPKPALCASVIHVKPQSVWLWYIMSVLVLFLRTYSAHWAISSLDVPIGWCLTFRFIHSLRNFWAADFALDVGVDVIGFCPCQCFCTISNFPFKIMIWYDEWTFRYFRSRVWKSHDAFSYFLFLTLFESVYHPIIFKRRWKNIPSINVVVG